MYDTLLGWEKWNWLPCKNELMISHLAVHISFFSCMYKKVLESFALCLFCSLLELWGQGLLHIRGSASHHSLHHAQEDQRLLPLCITRLLIGQRLFICFSKVDPYLLLIYMYNITVWKIGPLHITLNTLLWLVSSLFLFSHNVSYWIKWNF